MVENNQPNDRDERRAESSSDKIKPQSKSEKTPPTGSEDDDLDFVVTETGAEQRDFVGGTQQFTPKDEAIDIEASAGSDCSPDDDEESKRRYSQASYSQPIGMSAPPPPPGADQNLEPSESFGSANQKEAAAAANTPANGRDLPKLSEAQIRSIREKMYGQSQGLSEKDKKEILQNADQAKRPLFDTEPIVPPKKNTEKRPDSAPRDSQPRHESPDVPKPVRREASSPRRISRA